METFRLKTALFFCRHFQQIKITGRKGNNGDRVAGTMFLREPQLPKNNRKKQPPDRRCL